MRHLLGVLLAVAVSAQADEITIDYNDVVATGSPHVFGGTQPRGLSDSQWDVLEAQGFKFMRSQADMASLVPCDSPEEYNDNAGGCADPGNWNWSGGIYGNNFAQRAIDRGMSVCLVIKNATWNRYDGAPYDEETMPRDLDVHEDIIRKIINHYQGGITYIENFNEIDRSEGGSYPQFRTDGSPYSRESGYKEVVYHAIQAAKTSEYPETRVGGPAAMLFGEEEAEWLLSDERIAPDLGFISFHDFDNPEYPREGVEGLIALREQYNADIPIVRSSHVPEFNRSQGVPGTLYPEYVAPHHIGAFKHGLEGSGLWEIQNRDGGSDPRWWFDGSDNPATAKHYIMGSVTLGLGDGPSTIVATRGVGWDRILGAINSHGDYVALFVAQDNGYTADVTMEGVALEGTVTIKVYRGDEQSDGETAVDTKTATVDNGILSFSFSVDEHSVFGVKLEGEPSTGLRGNATPVNIRRAPREGVVYDIHGRMVSRTSRGATPGRRGLSRGVYVVRHQERTTALMVHGRHE
jgi:hypothetical protein